MAAKHTSDNLDLSNTVRVSEDNTDLRRGGTFLCELADLIDDLVGGGLQPRRWRSRIGNCGGRYALSVAVKTTHVCGGWIELVSSKFAKIMKKKIMCGLKRQART